MYFTSFLVSFAVNSGLEVGVTGLKMLRLQLKSSRALTRVVTDVSSTAIRAALGCMIPVQTRFFTNSSYRSLVKPYLLADIGEGISSRKRFSKVHIGLIFVGITECQVISWSVKPGDRVEQFEPICEVQSDKAAVDVRLTANCQILTS